MAERNSLLRNDFLARDDRDYASRSGVTQQNCAR
jgi:hypothetical protein